MMNAPNVTHMKRLTVSLSADVVDALDDAISKHEAENYSQALRKAVRTAFIEK